MKTKNTNLFTPLDKGQMQDLTQEVKETLATGTTKNILSAADLWNIQRMRRVRVQRRYFV